MRLKRGVILLITLLALSLIIFTAVALLSLTRAEEIAAENSVLDVRAKFLALSGVTKSAIVIRNWYSGIQPGKKRHVLGEEPQSPQTSEEHLLLPWSYVDQKNIEDFNPSKELENNLNVSLKKYEVEIEGIGKIGLSGVLNVSEDYVEGYSLKILDVPSQIFINASEGEPLSPNIIKMLNSLGEILAEKYNFNVKN